MSPHRARLGLPRNDARGGVSGADGGERRRVALGVEPVDPAVYPAADDPHVLLRHRPRSISPAAEWAVDRFGGLRLCPRRVLGESIAAPTNSGGPGGTGNSWLWVGELGRTRFAAGTVFSLDHHRAEDREQPEEANHENVDHDLDHSAALGPRALPTIRGPPTPATTSHSVSHLTQVWSRFLPPDLRHRPRSMRKAPTKERAPWAHVGLSFESVVPLAKGARSCVLRVAPPGPRDIGNPRSSPSARDRRGGSAHARTRFPLRHRALPFA
jgi:hypothetical protein